jgi:hypothetical protein
MAAQNRRVIEANGRSNLSQHESGTEISGLKKLPLCSSGTTRDARASDLGSNSMESSSSNSDLAALARQNETLEHKLDKLQINDSTTRSQTEPSQTGESQSRPDKRLVPAPPKSPASNEIERHDTTIHTNVKPPIIHETIRPIETNIITTEREIHHHIHHYVHRIQPVVVTSDEEEELVHQLMREGGQPGGYRTRHFDTKSAPGDTNHTVQDNVSDLGVQMPSSGNVQGAGLQPGVTGEVGTGSIQSGVGRGQ